MISGIGIALYVRNRSQFFHFVSVLSFVFYCCYTLYILLPVAGPRVFLNAFVPVYTLPEQLHALAPVAFYPEAVTKGPFYVIMGVIYDVFESPGAAFPSSHVAAALCTLYFSFRYLPRAFPFHTVAVLLLCLSTIYGRYHYAVDVLAGILTALVLIPVGNNLYARFSGKRGDLTNGTASKLPLRAQP
jgi:membrane-associated phospholipid phosphatase